MEKDGRYDPNKNSIKLAFGGNTSLFMGINRENEFVLYSVGEDYSDEVVINYCPMCGRNLNKVKKIAIKVSVR